MLSLVARRRPLLFLSVPGTLISLLGLALGLYVTYTIETTGQLMIGSAMVTLLLIIGGLLLAICGVMLHSIRHFAFRLREEIIDLLTTHREPVQVTAFEPERAAS